MRAVVQRVSEASVKVDGAVIGQIGIGLLVLLGVQEGDTAVEGEWLAQKIAALRIFPDAEGYMNRSVVDISGEILVISQFTLLASTRKGTRPSFNDAAKPDIAIPLYEGFVQLITRAIGKPVATGHFAADMKVSLVNDGPVTIVIDSRNRS